MSTDFELLDVVALTQALPDHDLQEGQVGTVIEILAPGIYEVEFSDDDGRTYAQLPVEAGHLLKLRHKRIPAG